MSDDDRVLIVCSVLSLEQLALLRGNRAEDCSRCGQGVVLSTEGQALRASEQRKGMPVELVCIPCAVRDAGDEHAKVIPGAVERAQREGYPLSAHTRAAMERRTIRESFPNG